MPEGPAQAGPSPPETILMAERCATYKSSIPVSAAAALDWHRRDGAFERLVPPWADVRVRSSRGSIEPGDGQELAIKFGPLDTEWSIVHDALDGGTGFLDRQTSGPFADWTHEHRFSEEANGYVALEDRIRYQIPLGAFGDRSVGGRIQDELDRTFIYRHQITRHDLNTHDRFDEQPGKRIAITGASGLVGSRLVPFLRAGGHTVHRLVRSEASAPDEIAWDPATGRIDADALEGFDAVIHLAGVSISGSRWSSARKEAIRSSRVQGTTLLAQTLASLQQPPAAFVSTSAVGIYGSRGDEELTETSSAGTGFLADVCQEWESAADSARTAGIRVVHPRFGVVIAGEGGMLKQLLLPFKLGVGGRIGNGKQYLSWIAIDDLLSVLLESVMNDSLVGPVNAVAPESVTNEEFTKALGATLHRPTLLPLPETAVKVAFGEMADELLLTSQRTEPARLNDAGFQFSFPTIQRALEHELAPNPGADIEVAHRLND